MTFSAFSGSGRIPENVEKAQFTEEHMADPQLTIIIDKELPDILSSHGETVTIHPVSRETISREEKTIKLDAFYLLDDSSVRCIPKIKVNNFLVTDFEICFDTEVSPSYLYEISLYLIVESRKLKHVQTLNAGPRISLQSIFKFPIVTNYFFKDVFDTCRPKFAINGSFVFFTKISRKDVLYALENKPQMLFPMQITDCSLLFENSALTDCTIIVEGREFRIHKQIISAKSQVFLTMFEIEMKEKKENRVTIEDMEADVFNEMLRYIYTNNIRDLNVHAENLLKAADKYILTKLKIICVDELTRSLNVENASHILSLADQYNAGILKERAIHFIKFHIQLIFRTQGYASLCRSPQAYLLSDIIQAALNLS